MIAAFKCNEEVYIVFFFTVTAVSYFIKKYQNTAQTVLFNFF